ncbi:MAG: ComEA family DNA-binding protein [Lachnospiraceae bacterium]|nr:ComEA family DNA-binding protein [Lachnospiraceae bacterium]MEE1342352.1 ComEA family DNA-binding protein [Lachnospiraceae bacterium]
MQKMKLFFVTFSILSLLFIVGCNQDQVEVHATKKEVEASTEKKATKEESTVEKKSDTIFVYVCGSVKRPDVYEVEADGRIVDAVKAAGGFLKDADKNAVNLAQSLTDGQQIYIPSVKEQSKSNNEQQEQNNKSGNLISLNHATKEELMTLPGIGESKANLIIQYREEKGGFSKIEQIMEIQGIKEGVFNKIKDDITI